MDTNPGEALAKLSIQKGPGAGTDLAVSRPVVSIGRGSQNDVVIDDDSISTRHARLEYGGEGWLIFDLDSANGTFVEGERLAPEVPAALRPGASVRFGAVVASFAPVEGADPEAARRSFSEAPARTPVAARSGFRLPLWVLLVLILVVAAVWFGLVWTPEPAVVPDPAPDAVGLLLETAPLPAPA